MTGSAITVVSTTVELPGLIAAGAKVRRRFLGLLASLHESTLSVRHLGSLAGRASTAQALTCPLVEGRLDRVWRSAHQKAMLRSSNTRS